MEGLGVGDLAKDNVLAVEPRGDNGGDEELGAVTAEKDQSVYSDNGNDKPPSQTEIPQDLRVGASVGHGEQTGAVVLVLEVLIGELVAVDGATTGALFEQKTVRRGRSKNNNPAIKRKLTL